jgi:GAF domain-containing protein/multidrug resistance efflux pump
MPLSNDFVIELAVSLLAAGDSAARARLIALAVIQLLPDSACIIHRLSSVNGEPAFLPVGIAGDLSLADNILPADRRLLTPLLSEPARAVIYSSNEFVREDYAHLHVSRSVSSLAYLPLLVQDQLAGAIEILAFAGAFRSADLAAFTPIAQIAGPAILAAEESERERQDLLDSVHRMSQLYDLEKSLNATLEIDEVSALAPEKAVAMLGCQAVHLWLFEGELLKLMSTSGTDSTVEPGMTMAPGEGYVADMAEEGEPLLIADADDERLVRRNAVLGDPPASPPITSSLIVPLMQEDAEVGVIEAVNKTDGNPFDDDDQFFLSAMAETVSNALKNASLMLAERKLAILKALVSVSSEITSTLRLDRLFQIIVNSPQNVLPFDRCSIALDNRGSLQLKAVSGMAAIPLGDAQVDRLNRLIDWLSTQPDALHLCQREESAPGTELPEVVAQHFELTGYRALYSLPLVDDQGRVGLLLYEAENPDFLDEPHFEMIKILAGQTTVAIRNALLYREVPLISLLEPLMLHKRALMRTSRGRRIAYEAVAVVVMAFLVLCPIPMRIVGEAVVAPQRIVTVAAPLDGNVAKVYAHEGQRVAIGDLLGAMNDLQWRMDLASAEAKYHSAQLVMESSLAHGSPQAGADRAQAEFLNAEAERARSRVENAQLRSPIAGVVATPVLENAAGEHLDAGATFAQILDLSSAVVDVAVAQGDVSLVQPGQPTVIKLDSYPRYSWHGAVDVVSPQAQPGDGVRTFAARIPVSNDEAVLRSGMTGHAKIFIGYRPAGYVLLRSPALWLWQTLWNWIGW